MGKQEESIDTPNHQRRKAPPSLSVPGAHPSRGLDLEFGRQGLNTSYYGKTDDTGPRASFGQTKADSAMSSGFTERTESSVEASLSPAAIPLESDYFDRTIPEGKKHLIIPIVLMILIAVLAVIVPVSVIFGRGSTSSSQHSGPHIPAPLAVKPNLTLEELQVLVPTMTEATLARINRDPLSPQALAVDWIESSPYNWTRYDDWRKIQRYAMAVLHYAMGGPGWDNFMYVRVDWLSYHMHECDWMKNSKARLGDMCNKDQQMVQFNVPGLNYLRGTLPPEISYLSHLEKIDLTRSQVGKNLTWFFTDVVDQDMSHYLPALDTLVLMDTELSGTIPSSLGTLTGMTHLDLSMNDLVQTIPSELGMLDNLETLVLSSNSLTGSIPSELGSLSFLASFSVEDNKLKQGPLPEEFCMQDHESFLDMTTDWCQSTEECCSQP